MGTLFFVCPTTGRAVLTGVEIDLSSYSSLPSRTGLRCPQCEVLTGVEIDLSSYSSLPSRTGLRCPQCDEIHSKKPSPIYGRCFTADSPRPPQKS
jgi:uncharacterized C2H2 Zn-finger protein